MRLIDISTAAAEIGVHPRTIRRRIADGDLKAYRFGPRLLRVDGAEVEALLKPLVTAGSHR